LRIKLSSSKATEGGAVTLRLRALPHAAFKGESRAMETMELTLDALSDHLRDKAGVDMSKVKPDTPLFTSGLVDSFSMVELVLLIESKCGIKMKATDVNLDNLDSIERILAFVEMRCGGRAAAI
jgi:D-alanine--poly(phosphoribitol) ligase subunit 2